MIYKDLIANLWQINATLGTVLNSWGSQLTNTDKFDQKWTEITEEKDSKGSFPN